MKEEPKQESVLVKLQKDENLFVFSNPASALGSHLHVGYMGGLNELLWKWALTVSQE